MASPPHGQFLEEEEPLFLLLLTPALPFCTVVKNVPVVTYVERGKEQSAEHLATEAVLAVTEEAVDVSVGLAIPSRETTPSVQTDTVSGKTYLITLDASYLDH